MKKDGENTEMITVRHGSDEDELGIIINAWEKDNMVSVKDPWKGVNNLTAFDDIESIVSLFEDIVA